MSGNNLFRSTAHPRALPSNTPYWSMSSSTNDEKSSSMYSTTWETEAEEGAALASGSDFRTRFALRDLAVSQMALVHNNNDCRCGESRSRLILSPTSVPWTWLRCSSNILSQASHENQRPLSRGERRPGCPEADSSQRDDSADQH